jgi:hypothetical protein
VAILNATTVVSKGYETVVLLAGDEVPDWAADQIGEHLTKAVEQPEEQAESPKRRTRA